MRFIVRDHLISASLLGIPLFSFPVARIRAVTRTERMGNDGTLKRMLSTLMLSGGFHRGLSLELREPWLFFRYLLITPSDREGLLEDLRRAGVAREEQ
jgi:hypothetical protein